MKYKIGNILYPNSVFEKDQWMKSDNHHNWQRTLRSTLFPHSGIQVSNGPK